MDVDYSTENLPEHAEIQFTDFELTYTDRASQEQRSATLSGDGCTVELDKIPSWTEG